MAPRKVDLGSFSKEYGKFILHLETDSIFELDLEHPIPHEKKYASTTHRLEDRAWNSLVKSGALPKNIEEEKKKHTGNEMVLLVKIDSLEIHSYHGQKAIRINWSIETLEDSAAHREEVRRAIARKKNDETVDTECYKRWLAKQVSEELDAQEDQILRLRELLKKRNEEIVKLETRSEEIAQESKRAEGRLEDAKERNEGLRGMILTVTAQREQLEQKIQEKNDDREVTGSDHEAAVLGGEELEKKAAKWEEKVADSIQLLGKWEDAVVNLKGGVADDLEEIKKLKERSKQLTKDLDSENRKTTQLKDDIKKCQADKKSADSRKNSLKKSLKDRQSGMTRDTGLKSFLENKVNTLQKFQDLRTRKSQLVIRKKTNDQLKEAVKIARERLKSARLSVRNTLDEDDTLYPSEAEQDHIAAFTRLEFTSPQSSCSRYNSSCVPSTSTFHSSHNPKTFLA